MLQTILCGSAVGDPQAALAVTADVVAITGKSRRWGCWAERAPELMAIAAPDTPEHELWRKNHEYDLREAYGALSSTARACPNLRVPMRFVEPFIENCMWTVALRPLDLLVHDRT
ncbi:hypothetical protein [Nocardia sp. NPDC060259]|uniref:hypothetical protein n=1 Tax=Nocardia sp. NPDC060259 TaxID=3347088 RepID=UPI0036647F4A